VKPNKQRHIGLRLSAPTYGTFMSSNYFGQLRMHIFLLFTTPPQLEKQAR
jgi:hypothetical protein